MSAPWTYAPGPARGHHPALPADHLQPAVRPPAAPAHRLGLRDRFAGPAGLARRQPVGAPRTSLGASTRSGIAGETRLAPAVPGSTVTWAGCGSASGTSWPPWIRLAAGLGPSGTGSSSWVQAGQTQARGAKAGPPGVAR